ncbi:thiamine kinase-like enzyme [Sinomonas atrocyanea]|uniref:phosphotransferase n=1 Tax=Sinomonas atrocyanea TaxID=37927 RepID=UPI0027840936|nr:phosphotransferase [Sinomonas atrocyanea]MDP9886222.1 thiamine kinase-like enzyme [Sinomonas atrocyanea]
MTTTTISEHELEIIRTILSAAPGWTDITAYPLSGGNAHKNYRVESSDRSCVVKVWNNYWTSVGVCPEAEVVLQNSRTAAEVGVGAPVIAVSTEPPGIGLDFLTGGHPRLQEDPDAVERLVPALKRLHNSGRRFANAVNPFEVARERFAAARARSIPFPAGFEVIERIIDRLEHTLALDPAAFVPCHLDIWDANIVKATPSGPYRIIDWDLSGNSDPGYELGFVAAFNGFDPERSQALFQAYFGSANPVALARARLFMTVAHWSNCALWITALGNTDPNEGSDFEGELRTSWEGLLTSVTTADFHHAIAQAAKPGALV